MVESKGYVDDYMMRLQFSGYSVQFRELESYGLHEHATEISAHSLSNFGAVCGGLWLWPADLIQVPTRKVGGYPRPRDEDCPWVYA